MRKTFSRLLQTSRLRLLALALMLATLLTASPATAAAPAAASGESEINPVIALFLLLGLILLASQVSGAIARKLNQPRVLGQLLIGVLLGPTFLNMLQWGVLNGAQLGEIIHQLAEIGVLLLMFNIGLEVHINELAKVGKVALLAGFAGVVVPVVLVGLIVLAFGYSWQPALFAGVVMAATSVSISAQVLFELDVLRTKVGNALLATALVDDVLAIILVSLTLAIETSTAGFEIGPLLGIIARMAIYIVVAFAVAWFLLPRLLDRMERIPELAQAQGLPTFALVLAFLFGWSAEALGGVAAITGAFIAGVGLSRMSNRSARREIAQAVSNVSYVFVVPFFFINVGLQTDLSAFPWGDALLFSTLVLVAAVLSKVIGVGIGARGGGFDNLDSLRLGICMVSRGEVGLIIASLGITSGIFSATDDLFSVLFLVILLTTVVTPPFVRWVFHYQGPVSAPTAAAVETE